MASILNLFSGSKFPKTEKYENENKHLKDSLAKYKKLEKSKDIIRYYELDTLVHSGDFEQKVIKLKKERFKNTDAFLQFKKFKEHKRSSNVKNYNKFVRKGKMDEAEELFNTSEIQTFLQLKKYVESTEFAEIKSEMNDRHRFRKSKEHQQIQEFKSLSNSEDIIWFLKIKNNNPFKDINKWKLTFEDHFNATQLDKSKWITGYYWGKALLKDTYVQANEKQFFQDENLELRDSCLRIITKNEECQGKIWDSQLGFVPQKFDFSSGLISTGQSFRQKYGRFEAKIKYSHTTPALHTFWLLSEQITPQINILKTPGKNKNKIEVGNFWRKDNKIDQKVQKLKIPGSSQHFFIYSLEWSKNKLEWKINGVTVHTQTENIPQVPMYLSLSTHFTNTPKVEKLPISMDIDWVRCYEIN